ncbi:MAG: glycosyltransferase [Pseudomonadales bacterium]|nr:glycosyltransferase [Pseudomonadales bacterium]MBO7004766.1 glycosyltransferase [Pseudomonadales bacterium]
MKVLQVTPTYLPATRYGGPIFSVHGLCRTLTTSGCDLEVVTTNVDGNRDSDVPLGTPVEVDGVRVVYFGSRVLRRLYFSFSMARYLFKAIQQADVIHVHSLYLWPTLVACTFSRWFGKPYVLAPRGMLVQRLILEKNSVLKRLWLHLFDYRNIRRAAALHLTSRKEAQEVQAMTRELPPLWIVPNGVEVPSENHWQGSDSQDNILFIGRINWEKGLGALLDALADGAPGQLTIAGNDEEGLKKDLQQSAREQAIENRVKFLDHVSGDEKNSLMNHADLFVLPSPVENFGIAALEAMASGCPTVVTTGCGLSSEVEDPNSLHTVRPESGAFSSAISDLLGSLERRQDMSLRGFREGQRFAWNGIANEMMAHYEELLS